MRQYIGEVTDRLLRDVKEYVPAVAAVFAYIIVMNLIFHALCPLVIVTGFPCPGCGLTRAAGFFLVGKWKTAWEMNPVIFPIAAAAAYFAVNRYLRGRKAKGMKGILIALVVLLCVVYCLRMYLYFPGKTPCVYVEDNLLEKVSPPYRQILHQFGIV
jgi:hypothetical protein